MTRILMALPILIVVVIGGFLFWGLDPKRDPSKIPSVLISSPVPEFELPPLEGIGVPGLSKAALMNTGEPVLVNVFASWCVPCRAEHAVLTRMVREDGVRLMGINYKDPPEDALAWLEELGNPYERIGSDLSGRAAIEWGLTGLPETYIVSGTGKIVYKYIGPIVGAEAEAEFAEALRQARADEARAAEQAGQGES